jgi:Helix-turn-helix domain
MGEASRQLDLSEESLGAQGGGQLRLQDLDGDPTVVLGVLRQIHRCHAARAELALDGVAALEGFGEAIQRSGHERTWLRMAIDWSKVLLDGSSRPDRYEPIHGLPASAGGVRARSPMDVIWEFRLQQAATWLRDTDATVAEVAYGVGFKRVPHFTRRFRDRFGATPAAYRRG